MAKYLVRGYALVPVELRVELEANSRADAIRKAREKFTTDKERMVVDQSQDYSAVFDWAPEAEPI